MILDLSATPAIDQTGTSTSFDAWTWLAVVVTVPAAAPPFRTVAGRVWHAGAAQGQTFTAGQVAGDIYLSGAVAGKVTR